MTDVQHIECTIEEYHAMEGVWSNSQVKLLPHDPVLFCRRHITKEFPFKPTASTKLGDAVHRILLDGTRVKVIPDEVLGKGKNRPRTGKAWDDFKAEHADKVLVKRGDAESEAIKHMVASVRAEPMARKLLEAEGHTEHTLVYTDEETGLRLRLRPDRILSFTDGLVIPDIKSTEDPLPAEQDPDHFFRQRYLSRDRDHFLWQIAKWDHHRQAAWYSDGVALWLQKPVIADPLIAVRNKSPFECVVHDLDDEWIEEGRQENRLALDELKRRLDSGDWNLSSHGQAVPTGPPPGRYRKENEYARQ